VVVVVMEYLVKSARVGVAGQLDWNLMGCEAILISLTAVTMTP